MLANFGLLILRVVVGLLLMGHGAQKLFGWFGGGGLQGTAGWIGKMGFRPAVFWAFMAGLGEFGGGLLTVLGLLNPLGPLGIIAVMLMATFKAHWGKPIWNTKGGPELPIINIAAVLAIALLGSGAFSLDSILHIELPEPLTLIVGLVVVLVGLVAGFLTVESQTHSASQHKA